MGYLLYTHLSLKWAFLIMHILSRTWPVCPARPSVSRSVFVIVSVLYLSHGGILEVFTLRKDSPWPEGVSWPKVFRQVQDHWKEKCITHVCSISFFLRNIWSSSITQRLLMTQSMSRFWFSHLGKVKVIERKKLIICVWFIPFLQSNSRSSYFT